ncbi:polysaccharide pyruvyl transferase family protein [Verrucomicrobia bacterium S94]|nr:polysaccharide pyruvyl transferase family protein [Verrucomicrobia bacterium S94]
MTPFLDKALNRAYWLKQRVSYSLFPDHINQDVPALVSTDKEATGKRIGHVAMYTDGNAGDTLLPRTVRDAVDLETPNHWTGIHAHRTVNKTLLKNINDQDGLLIGGGGLFLRDTNPNNLSGWQWSCSLEALKRIEIPIALFAVGYNRFRNQPDFRPVFQKHLEQLTRKSVFIGLRNSGSIRAVKSYLPEELHHKVRYQPCPTTLCRMLYPGLCGDAERKKGKPQVVLNCAFDRIQLRLGKKADIILNELAQVAKELSNDCRIAYYAHARSDHQMLPYLNKAGVTYDMVDLFHIHPREVVKAYAKPALVIGMRGHAQMIPFGCGTPILSLVSHDKIRWFLDDIKRKEWGVEMTTPDFKEHLISSARRMLKNNPSIRKSIHQIQNNLLEITRRNALDFLSELK